MSKFDDFWNAYPRKEGKAACLKKWQQKRLDDSAMTIVAHVTQRAKDDKKWKDGYVPMPMTFLNQERWTDEYERIKYRSAEPQKEAEQLPPAPQQCGYQAAANSILMVVLRRVGGVPDSAIRGIIADKQKLAERFRALGDGVPPDEQKRIVRAATEWLTDRCRKARESAESARAEAA